VASRYRYLDCRLTAGYLSALSTKRNSVCVKVTGFHVRMVTGQFHSAGGTCVVREGRRISEGGPRHRYQLEKIVRTSLIMRIDSGNWRRTYTRMTNDCIVCEYCTGMCHCYRTYVTYMNRASLPRVPWYQLQALRRYISVPCNPRLV